MQTFRTILFAADFSEHSTAAFRVDCSLAMGDMTRLIALHVVELDWVAKTQDYFGQGALPFSQTEGVHEFLKRRLAEADIPPRLLDKEYRTSDGSAAEEILRLAEAIGANLIAVGKHGAPGFAGSCPAAWLPGSWRGPNAPSWPSAHDRGHKADAGPSDLRRNLCCAVCGLRGSFSYRDEGSPE